MGLVEGARMVVFRLKGHLGPKEGRPRTRACGDGIAKHGGDMPSLGGWKWGQGGAGPAAAKRDTAADNV